MATRKKNTSPYAAPVGALVGGVLAGSIPALIGKVDTKGTLPAWVDDAAPAVIGLGLVLAAGQTRPGVLAAGTGMLAIASAGLMENLLDKSEESAEMNGAKLTTARDRFARYLANKKAAQAQAAGREMRTEAPQKEKELTRSGTLAMAEAYGCN